MDPRNLLFLNSHNTAICLSLLLWLHDVLHEGYVDLSPEEQISLNIERGFDFKATYNIISMLQGITTVVCITCIY